MRNFQIETKTYMNTITRAADILKVLSEGTDRISDISYRLSLSKSTIHRFLKSLGNEGFVKYDCITRRYHLGPLIIHLASKPFTAHQGLVDCAFESMKSLRDLTRETLVLHIRSGLERICLEELEGLENIKYMAGKGATAPIYTGSAGKLLLSQLEDNELQLLLKNLRLLPVGPNTITDKQALMKELDKVKEHGYATSFGERIGGSASISVLVGNYICPVSLSILGPDNRFSLKIMMQVLGEMKKRAREISRKIRSLSKIGNYK